MQRIPQSRVSMTSRILISLNATIRSNHPSTRDNRQRIPKIQVKSRERSTNFWPREEVNRTTGRGP